ncbi:hypothetical protein LIER_31490 [Lithospermum erythrorhizon]|uniref:Uncharacterized protein n=1 Tax=Lithospermum erythrorhizon TaxID=34254 RepID=A0AAV3RV51_LITER
MDSNVDTFVVNVSDGQMIPPVVSGVTAGGVDGQNVPAFDPGVTLPPFVPGATIPAAAVPALGGGESGVIPPAFATTVTLPPSTSKCSGGAEESSTKA